MVSGDEQSVVGELREAMQAGVLDLSGQSLLVVPPEIGQLSNLKQLILSDSELAELPPEIGQITGLEVLHLGGTDLIQLPPEIGQLTNLQVLDLSATEVAVLPPEIGQLINLRRLNLTHSALTALPPEIGQLKNLQQLHFSSNKLEELPPEIYQLTGLQYLDLNHSRLTALRPEIGQLLNLQRLDLSVAELTTLPPEIGQLTNLKQLNLFANQLIELPPEIGQLLNLEEFNLRENKLIQLPPEIGRLTRLEELDLRYNELIELPSEIGQLASLRVLDLRDADLAEIPPEIGQLAELEELYLGQNDLTEVPPEIMQLTSLQRLAIDENYLTELPPGIAQLARLEELYLDHNKLTEVPPEIGQLVSLQRLELDGNQLTEVPPEIGQLVSLQRLALDGNNLIELPSEIAQLAKLEELYLDHNKLTEVPLAIMQLMSLERLDLGNNLLTELPPEIGQLTNLKELDLGSVDQPTLPLEINRLSGFGNRLTQLPPEIGRLTSLEQLNLSENRLTALPSEIGQLTNLKRLDLSDNQLATLPRQLANVLTSYSVVDLRGNPLNEPFSELAERGTDALAIYLNSLETAVPLYETKVILVGEGNVGKTSLVAALRGTPFIEDRPTTHGIKIMSLTMRHPELGVEMTIRSWDFGGQEVYRISHQFFFSRRALYLVVWSAREGQEQNEVEGWLRRIRLRVRGDARALVVATHCTERRPELDYPNLKRRFYPLLVDGYEVDNSTGFGIAELGEGIAEQAALLPQMGQLISPRWIAARDDILSQARVNPQISYMKFADTCLGHGVEGDEVATLAELMHDLGQIVYYGSDEGLRDFVVLDPEWLTKAISYVLEDEPTRQFGGVLDHARLTEIWQNEQGQIAYPLNYHVYFLRLMEKFDISYRLEGDEYRSLVAQLVPHDSPDLPWESSTPPKEGVRALSFICQLSEPVPGLIAWLTVRHHRASTGKHWRSGVFLEHPIAAYASEALITLKSPVQLAVDVRAPSPDMYFHVLRDSIEDLLNRRWPGLTYQILIPCPTRSLDGSGCHGKYPLKFLLGYRERGKMHAPCHECFEDWDISKLLTGFAQPDLPLQLELERLHEQVAHIGSGVDRLEGEVSRLEGYAAETADSIRRVMRIVSSEITDCPRLFTLTEENPAGARRLKSALQRRYRLVLWCEHPGYWHPWPNANYFLDKPKDWLLHIGPYANLIFKALRLVVPVAASVVEMVLTDEQLRRAQNELKLMTTLMADLPAHVIEDKREFSALETANYLTPAQGQAVRALRTLIFENDQTRAFGGMYRVQAPSGDIIWVCPDHHAQYDPGLPNIPAV